MTRSEPSASTSSRQRSALLRSRHAILMAGRPDKRPGELKEVANQAGGTLFVDPALVEGTLAEGYQRLADLDTAWERSVLVMFMVSEVHPFDDGNGRIARIMMNAELEAAGQMATTNAFEEAGDGVRLLMPSSEIFGTSAEVDVAPTQEPSDRRNVDLVRTYTRKDGTRVRAHTRPRRR